MTLPEPLTVTFSGLIGDIEKGLIKIPQFQRDFVWDIEKSANLIDSIIKGYPIGTFFFGKRKSVYALFGILEALFFQTQRMVISSILC